MSTSRAVTAQPYHHGDLRNALIAAGVELGRQGGPDAIVLREAARRVGVSPNAAYRHFADLTELAGAVARSALNELGVRVRRDLRRYRPVGDAGEDAWGRLRTTGRAYVDFALAEPGLFACAFDRDWRAVPDPNPADPGPNPMDSLVEALDGLVAVGRLLPADVEAARVAAWAGVHGLSLLLLGPLSAIPRQARDAVIDASIERIGYGILAR